MGFQGKKPQEKVLSCPRCKTGKLVKRESKGKTFYGCSNYPNCDYVSWFEPTNEKCPNCGTNMVKKYSKIKGEYLECPNGECKYKKYNEKKQEIINAKNKIFFR